MTQLRYKTLGMMLLIGLAISCCPTSTFAQDEDGEYGTFKFAMNRLSKQVAQYLKAQNTDALLIGDFEGPSNSTAGKAIQQALTVKLRDEHNIKVGPQANNLKLSGDFEVNPDTNPPSININVTVRDRLGRKNMGNFSQFVQDPEITDLNDFNRLVQTNLDLSDEQKAKAEKLVATKNSSEAAKQADEVLDAKQKEAITNPDFALPAGNSTQVKPSKDSLFRMEMLVRRKGDKTYVPVKIRNESGVPTTEQLSEGDEYIIKIYNDASHSIGVKVFVDGINTFAISQDQDFKELGTWLVGPKSSGFIKGWYESRDNAGTGVYRDFVLTTQEQIPDLPQANGIGVISAQVFHAWTESEPTPQIELLAKNQNSQSIGRGLRTGIGDATRSDLRVERSFFGSQLLASISLRYSFPENLPPVAPGQLKPEPVKADL